mgnify:CR=1 FL=1
MDMPLIITPSQQEDIIKHPRTVKRICQTKKILVWETYEDTDEVLIWHPFLAEMIAVKQSNTHVPGMDFSGIVSVPNIVYNSGETIWSSGRNYDMNIMNINNFSKGIPIIKQMASIINNLEDEWKVKIIDNIQTNGILGSSVYSFSDNGRLVYLKGIDVAVSSGDFKLDILNRDGVNIDDIPVSGRVGQLSISNDAKKLAYTAYDGSLNDIWVWDFDQNISGRRTFNGISLRPNWYKNDELIVYTNIAESRDMNGIWTAPSDGTGEPKEIFNDTTMSNLSVQSISDSQNKLFFFSGNSQFESKENTIFELDLGADPSKKIELKAFDVSPGVSEVWWARATISPDGNWLLYVSNESGLNQVYIRPYPNINAGKWQISASDASSPIWSRNTDEIFFRSGNKFYKVDYDIVETESSSFINIDEPEFLFQHTIIENHLTFPGWVHNPVEDNFVIVSNPDASETNYNSEIFSNQTTLTVVENWFNELNTLAPRFTK